MEKINTWNRWEFHSTFCVKVTHYQRCELYTHTYVKSCMVVSMVLHIIMPFKIPINVKTFSNQVHSIFFFSILVLKKDKRKYGHISA